MTTAKSNTTSTPSSTGTQSPNLKRYLLAEGLANGPAAVRHVQEFSLHEGVSSILMTRVPVLDATGKPAGSRLMSSGELLDFVRSEVPQLQGKPLPRAAASLVVDRPKKTETAAARTVLAARSRAGIDGGSCNT